MIEAISRQPSEMVELQNSRQRLWVNGDFAAAFRGATKESQAPRELPDTAAPASSVQQKALEAGASVLASGTGLVHLVDIPAAVPTPITSPAAPSAAVPQGVTAPQTTAAPQSTTAPQSAATDSAGWSGPPNQIGSAYNPVAGWGQVPGQQPSWISGNYPGADWTAVSDSGFLMPYSSLSAGPGEDMLSGANENVVDQDWSKYYDQVDGPQLGNQIVWGANNPTDAVPAPWLNSNNLDPQYTVSNPLDPSQPTQPNYVATDQAAT